MNTQQETKILKEILAEIQRNSQIIKDLRKIIKQDTKS